MRDGWVDGWVRLMSVSMRGMGINNVMIPGGDSRCDRAVVVIICNGWNVTGIALLSMALMNK